MTVTEARADLPSLLDAVERGQEITITRHGKAVAVLMGVDLARQRRLARSTEATARIRKMLDDAKSQRKPLVPASTLTVERAEEWIAEIRAARDRDRHDGLERP